ncbi:Tripeptidyl-peptidase 2 [Hibiscus syriacus]|uniref:Tripeptidyl-peptidase 2 n=1 Tax=Hibiscus syriacus TaxID=106335 RepID=A0A6A2ZR30_HIBSY|nr:Tripeptidyl-peptidase 2 [Hibiscus syriacus]
MFGRAYEYIQKYRHLSCVSYQIKVIQSGKSTPTSRGIYLREATACQQSTEWAVQVEPKFHDDASKLEEMVPFEECIELHSSDDAVVRAPEFLLLTNNGRTFNIVVDPTHLGDGLHYYEVYGIDCKAPWRGPLFRIPITITKPKAVLNRPPLVSFSKMSFLPASFGTELDPSSFYVPFISHIERRYIDVPLGASWVEATMRTYGFDTSRRFYVDTVQICPLKRPIKWESVVTFSSPTAKSFAFPVVGGQTMELAIAQFWSSGMGSHETTVVDFEIVFHGIGVNRTEVVLDGSEAPIRIEAEALLASEKLAPAATLNKRVYAMGDCYPEYSKLPKGEYTLQLYLRHDDVQYLEKMKQLVLFLERNLEEKDVIPLNFFSEPDGPMMGNGTFKSSVLVPGKKKSFYISPPNKDKLPKSCSQGSVLVGALYLGKLSYAEGKNPQKNPVSYQISYVVPPSKVVIPLSLPVLWNVYLFLLHLIDEDKGKNSSSGRTKSIGERLEEEVRDAKIKVFGSLKQDTDDDRSEWKKLAQSLKFEYPKYTPLLAKILESLLSRSNTGGKIDHYEEVISAENEAVDSINRDELAKFFSLKSDPEDEDAEKIKKEMETSRDQLADALYQKGLALAEIESIKGEKAGGSDSQSDLFEENFKELAKWVDIKSSKYGTIYVLRERRWGRLGTALKVLNDMIHDDGEPPKKKLYELKLSLLDDIGWSHLSTYERQWMHVRFPPSLPLF